MEFSPLTRVDDLIVVLLAMRAASCSGTANWAEAGAYLENSDVGWGSAPQATLNSRRLASPVKGLVKAKALTSRLLK